MVIEVYSFKYYYESKKYYNCITSKDVFYKKLLNVHNCQPVMI